MKIGTLTELTAATAKTPVKVFRDDDEMLTLTNSGARWLGTAWRVFLGCVGLVLAVLFARSFDVEDQLSWMGLVIGLLSVLNIISGLLAKRDTHEFVFHRREKTFSLRALRRGVVQREHHGRLEELAYLELGDSYAEEEDNIFRVFAGWLPVGLRSCRYWVSVVVREGPEVVIFCSDHAAVASQVARRIAEIAGTGILECQDPGIAWDLGWRVTE
jgi:hypothetical protein